MIGLLAYATMELAGNKKSAIRAMHK